MKICRFIDELGRLVIPAELLKAYGLKPGERVCFCESDDGFLIRPEKDGEAREEKDGE